ncbi:MAG: ComF family protein [Eubacteriales bacterium]|nr:ComF family protein [Eubacteriales bacterium]
MRSIFLEKLERLFYPQVCSFCDCLIAEDKGASERYVCRACESDLPFRFNDEIYPDHTPFLLVVSFYYEEPVLKALRQLKFHGRTDFASALAPYLYASYRRLNLSCDVIVPMPLHHKRLRQRGYNQAGLLGEALASLVGIPLVEDALLRVHESGRQSERKGREEKMANVQGVFQLNEDLLPALQGRRVLLLDDIVTSGATMTEAGLCLQAGGIDVLAMACAAGGLRIN